MNVIITVASVAAAAVLAFLIGYLMRKKTAEAKFKSAEEEVKKILENAYKEADSKKKEALVEAKEEIFRLKTESEKENKERRNEVSRMERRVVQKEENLDKKIENLEHKENKLNKKERELDHKLEEADKLVAQKQEELEHVSGLSAEEAKQLLLSGLEQEVKYDAALMIKEIESDAKENAEKYAREIVTQAIQRVSADHVSETTVSVVALPNDEMKGRIIGREGRNIRTLETMTGIDLIIDDTPEAVIISGFDPVRREVARIALEKLIQDGRIHPARIEEMVEKAQREVDQTIKEEGEQATFSCGVHGLHPELIKLLGRLRYRTSYGQNVLNHSVEVSQLAGVIAGELGLDITMAKRAGLLHDLGKAIDTEMEGQHAILGADMAKKYGESKTIVNAIAAHHGDVDPISTEAVLIQAADAISAARPGARRETLETYIKRLEKLEEIANSFSGVDKSFAIQAGREVRIMVKPDKIDDVLSVSLARDIVKRISSEMEYPGQIKVVVVRETRAVDYAK
ncbi:MAG: ribonuclease Y [Firmicutes bacterium]|nr:ribonuclease Y [Bacillota bacterium]